MNYKIAHCTMSDFSQIIEDICDFWGSDRTLSLHHPYLVHEFGNTAFVLKHEGIVIAYLFGFFSQTAHTGYVHLIAVREKYQKQGLGKLLYDKFTTFEVSGNAKDQGNYNADKYEVNRVSSKNNRDDITRIAQSGRR
jgi:GNAT superfamily N-acetyltransferase